MTPLALTIKQACLISGLSRSTIYNQFRAGKIVPRKCGGRTLILVSDLEEFLSALPVAEIR